MAARKIESVEEWEPYLDEIRRLYLDDGQSMKDIQRHLEQQHQISATYVIVLDYTFLLTKANVHIA